MIIKTKWQGGGGLCPKITDDNDNAGGTKETSFIVIFPAPILKNCPWQKMH